MIHPVLDQVALHQAVQVQAVLIKNPTNQKITMESLVKVCLHFLRLVLISKQKFNYLFTFVSADPSNSRAAHHKSHKSVNDSGYAYYHEPEHGKK